MRIVLAAAGSLGDVVPFAALGARLRQRGHDAVLVTHESLLPAVPGDLPCVGIASDPAQLMAGPAAAALRRGDLRAANRARGEFATFLASFATPTADVLGGADLLLASTFATAAVAAALRVGVPVMRAHQWPEDPGLDGPMPLLPYGWRLPPRLRRGARGRLRALEPLLAGFDHERRQGRLRLYPRHPAGFTTATHGTLHAVSPAVVAPAALSGTVTGWWWPDGGAEALDPTLSRNLAGGGPWVYVGFGSMHQRRPASLLRLVRGAAQLAGVRAVVQLPGAEDVVDPVLLGIGAQPHAALFPRLAAVVHHGGSGTTGAAVRAGVPSVVVPHFADQFYWAHRLTELGVAPRPVPRPVLTERGLARALLRALRPETRARAALLGARVRGEDGVGSAVAAIEAALGAPTVP